MKYLAQSAVGPTDNFSGIPVVNITANDVYDILIRFANWMFGFFLLIFVVFVIFAAFRYLTAAGNESKIKEAHQSLRYAVAALAVALLAGTIVYLVRELILERRQDLRFEESELEFKYENSPTPTDWRDNQPVKWETPGSNQRGLRWACYDPDTGKATGPAIGESGLDACNANCPRDCALCKPDGGVDCGN